MWHWVIPVVIYLKFPCVPVHLANELCATWKPDVQSFLIYISLLSSRVSVDSQEESEHQQEGCGFHQSRVRLPACLSACASLPRCHSKKKNNQNARKRKRQAGKPAEFWWVLTRRELGGKTERRRLSATPWDEMVSSSVQWKLCSLCSISVENMVGEQWGRADTMLVFCDWV